MRSLLSKLWNDDAGIVALEYLVLGTFLGLALIVGVTALSKSINAELAELGNAILTFNQGYNVRNYSNCGATKDGSGAVDTCQTTSASTSAFTGCNIDQAVCP